MLKVFYIGGSDEKVMEVLGKRLPQIAEAIRRRLDIVHAKLQQRIQRDKLQGQVLHQRTGKLINSIRMIPAEISGNRVTGMVEGAGGPAWYGAVHEFGTTRAFDIVPVNKKALSFLLDGKRVIVKRVHHPPFKERSFMRTALAEMEPQIVAELQAEVAKVVQG
jgi:hypothetical protein